MNIYLGNETDFNNNGLGFLTDVINAKIIDELNGNYELRLEYIMNGHLYEYLEEENIIKCPVADGTKQLFRITNVSKTLKTITVIAKHIFYDLNNNFLADVYPQNKNGQAFGQYLIDNANFNTQFTFVSDITNLKSARYIRINPTQAIMGDIDNSMVKLFGGELKRNNYTINFLSRVGEDNGVKLLIGKNITGINISIDITEMATRVMPQGYDNLLLPELYVDSPLLYQYPTPKIIKLEFSDVKYDPNDPDAYHTLDEAYAELRRLVNEQYSLGLDKPKININVDWVELSKTEEYKQYASLETVRLGDTITAQILDMNYTTRVIATEYDVLKDRIINFQIGTFQSSLATSINSLKQSVDEINPSSILAEAQNNATQLITSAMGGYVYKTNNELYIMDNADPQLAQKVWRWNINGLGYSSTGINGTYGLAMTMDGQIVADFITTGTLNASVIQGYGSLVSQVQDNTNAIGDRSSRTSTITQDIASIEAQIGDIADITTSASSDTAIILDTDLQNIAVSQPIHIEIYPIIDNITCLYPRNNLYPSNTLYPKIRDIKFTNTSTNETFTYTLPVDLLYYNSDNYDTFVADYETDLITITKKCKYNADGTIGLLDNPITTTMAYTDSGIDLDLTQGNYQVELPSYNSGYLFVRLMVLNAYTAQYATKVELRSAISQTKDDIELSVSQTLEYYSTTNEMNAAINLKANEINSVVSTKVGKTEVISSINQTAEQIKINASKIALEGYTTINNSFKIDLNGNFEANSGKIAGINIESTGLYYSGSSAYDGFGLWKNNIHWDGNGYIILHAGGNSANIGGAKFRVYQSGGVAMQNGAYYFNMGISTGNPNVSGLNVGGYGVKAYSGIVATGFGITDSDSGKSASFQVPRQGGGYYYITFTGGILTAYERH